MNKEQRRAIRKFQTWQMNKFARNAKKGYYFFQPDNVSLPTPRSARDAWGGTYTPQAEDDCGEKNALNYKHCIVPMPKSNYIVVTDLELLKGLNSSHKSK
jgi:hypothetical protein